VPPFRYDFSVIIATRNRPQLLRNCLVALEKSNYPVDRFEVVVVDDGSDAAVGPGLAEFTFRFSLSVLRTERGGPAAARNVGSRHASGRFLAFLDDDAEADRDWLSSLGQCLAAAPNDLVGGPVINALQSNAYSTTYHVVLNTAYQYFNSDNHHAHFFASSNMAMAAENFTALNGFGDWPLAAAEDRALCLRWLQRGWALSFAPTAIVNHRHALTFFSFIELYFRYGRGACQYHRLRARSGAPRLRPEWRFYLLCFRRAFGRPEPASPVAIVLLLCLWQLANACGYLVECFTHRRTGRNRS
jgi:GT2 family glycosyltransferase